LSTSETVMAIHISGGSFEVQEMKEGTFFLSLALFLAFFFALSPLVWYSVSAVMHVSSEGAVRVRALKCTVRPRLRQEQRSSALFKSNSKTVP